MGALKAGMWAARKVACSVESLAVSRGVSRVDCSAAHWVDPTVWLKVGSMAAWKADSKGVRTAASRVGRWAAHLAATTDAS